MSQGLLGGMFARGAAAAAAGEAALLQALLDVEAALARAWAAEGEIPVEAAETIGSVCHAGGLDADALGREAARHAQPVIPVVDALRSAVGEPAADYVHHRATSQDILDTGLMLVARRALEPLLGDLGAAADACAGLAREFDRTPMLGRTLLQPALPITFGLKACGWMSSLDRARAGLERVRDDALAVQLGGPVGVLDAPAVVSALAAELGLAAPVAPWHSDRTRPAQLAAALGVAAGGVAKPARDVTLLAQAEVGEAREGGRSEGGRSSSMAHKRNPVAAVSALACSARVPGLVATLLGVMAQEQERGAGLWQAEWEPLLELLRLTGSAAAWTRELVEGLEVDEERMSTHLEASGAPCSQADVDGAAALVARALEARAAG